MDKFTLTKSIEAKKLNPRTWVPTGEPLVTIPFGAIIQDLREERDVIKFLYLGEPFQCPGELLKTAMAPVQPVAKGVSAAAPSEAPSSEAVLQWQEVKSSHREVLRAKVPEGWLLLVAGALAFYPDAEHRWDGASLP
jgi:hypothetical protein